MPAGLFYFLVAFACLLLLVLPLRWALGVLLTVTFFVPDTALVSGAGKGVLTAYSVTLVAFLVGLGRRFARGGAPEGVFRITPGLTAAFLFVSVTFIGGLTLAEPTTPLTSALISWQLVAFGLVFFLAVSVSIRMIGDPIGVAKMVAWLGVAVALLGLVEHFTKWSYARWFLSNLPSQGLAFPLEIRGGELRVRGAMQFAVAYGWVLTMLFPLLMAAAARSRRIIAAAGPAVAGAAIVWTYTRSTYVAVLGVGIVLLIASRFDRRAVRLVVLFGAAAVVAVSSGAITRVFGTGTALGSNVARERQMQLVTEEVADRPILGRGLDGLGVNTDVEVYDSMYLILYGEQGIVGLGAFGLFFFVTLASIVRSSRSADRDVRLFGAASLAGFVAAGASGLSLGTLSLSAPARTMWLVAALGETLAERVPRERAPFRLRQIAWRVALPAVGVAAGVAAMQSAPTSATVTYRFGTVSPALEAVAGFAPVGIGELKVATACGLMTEVGEARIGTDANCIDLRVRSGIGQIRFAAPDIMQTRASADDALSAARRSITSFTPYLLDENPEARPTWALTAPVWMGMCGFTLALVIPRRRRRPPDSLTAFSAAPRVVGASRS